MTNTKNSHGGNGENNQNTEDLIQNAFERQNTIEGSTSGGDPKIPTTIKDGVGETGKRVIDVITNL